MGIISLLTEVSSSGCKGPQSVGLLGAVNKAASEARAHSQGATEQRCSLWRLSEQVVEGDTSNQAANRFRGSWKANLYKKATI